MNQEDPGQVILLARLAMQLGMVDRGLYREDGQWESDTDHSIQVAWLACAMAQKWYPHLDPGLVAQFAIVHDAVEVHAGDTYAVGLDAEAYQAKKDREHAAFEKLRDELPGLPWLAMMIERYESRAEPEARLVWAVDKLVTKISCMFDDCAEVVSRTTAGQRRKFIAREDGEMEKHASDFPEVLELRTLWMNELRPKLFREQDD
jgi:5'-deoxynucleotidase YfbR-like HD superfamily hydrolase